MINENEVGKIAVFWRRGYKGAATGKYTASCVNRKCYSSWEISRDAALRKLTCNCEAD